MTTAAWDGKTNTLATDSRLTHRGVHRSDDTIKIITFTNDPPEVAIRKDKFEPILALACSGVVAAFEGALDVLKVYGWATFMTVYGIMHRTKLKTSNLAFSMLIITASEVVVVQAVDGHPLEANHYPRDTQIAIGSGGKIAKFLMRHLGVSAPDAVAGSMLDDDGSGGAIQYITLENNVPKSHPRRHPTDKNEVRRQLKEAIGRFVVPKEPDLFDDAVLLEVTGGKKRTPAKKTAAKKTTRAKK